MVSSPGGRPWLWLSEQRVACYDFFVLEVVAAWIDPAVEAPRTLHHRGHGRFMLAGAQIQLDSAMR